MYLLGHLGLKLWIVMDKQVQNRLEQLKVFQVNLEDWFEWFLDGMDNHLLLHQVCLHFHHNFELKF